MRGREVRARSSPLLAVMQMDGFNRSGPTGHREFLRCNHTSSPQPASALTPSPGPSPTACLLAPSLFPLSFCPSLCDLTFLLFPSCLSLLLPPHSAPASLTQYPEGLPELPSLASIPWLVSTELPAPSSVTLQPAITVPSELVPLPRPQQHRWSNLRVRLHSFICTYIHSFIQ